MSKENGALDFIVSVVCLTVVAGGVGIFLGGVANTVNQLSPDYYWPSVGVGLLVALSVVYLGGKLRGIQKDPFKLMFATAMLLTGIVGLPVIVEVMGTADNSSIPQSVLYWGLPAMAFLATASSGSGFVDWDSKNEAV